MILMKMLICQKLKMNIIIDCPKDEIIDKITN